MDLTPAITRRMASVNRCHRLTISVEEPVESPSHGLHFMATISKHGRTFVEQFHLPKTVLHDLHNGGKNQNLDNALRIKMSHLQPK